MKPCYFPSTVASTSVILGGRCNLSCTVCDCREAAAAADETGVPHVVRAGGDRLFLRGEPSMAPGFEATLRAAEGRWGEVWVRTNGLRFGTPAAAAALAARGVRGAVIPLFAHVAAVHDKVAGRPGALVAALLALRTLAAAGLAVSVETPLLPTRFQDLEAVVRLAHRAVPALASYRFYVPRAVQPLVLAPPAWGEVRAPLGKAMAACRELGIPAPVHEFDAIPLCALGHDPETETVYRFDPRRPARARDGFSQGADCARCAVRQFCQGVHATYRAAHGEAGLQPFDRRPRRMFDQRTTPRRTWEPHQREAASKAMIRVLRPTIHCNQDCPFCSANETTENIRTDSGEMLRQIARVARQGIEHLSFSGGEPTLNRDLVHYIRAAKRLGVKKIELVTNGALIDSAEKVRPLADAGLNRAFVSLHAHDEVLSRQMTSKVGDWPRTVRAITALVEAGVWTDVNHVVTAVNFAYLPRFADFVADTWGAKVGISFAFVTPQFRALENADLVPRMGAVRPYLRRAMQKLVARRVRFVVGSRQGVPPCQLGEFAAWSDVLDMAPHAHAEDEPQKIRGPRCDTCRYSAYCVGVWRPYAARYGFDELTPVPGEALTDADLASIDRSLRPWLSFEDLPPPLRAEPVPDADADLPPPPELVIPRPRVSLPVVRSTPSRTLRVALLGSGPQAVRLARALGEVHGLSLAGVASPHLLDRDPGPFGDIPRETDAGALLDRVKPDVVIVAAATIAHHALTVLAAERGLPVLLEKPLAGNREQAEALVALATRAFVMPAHAMVFSPGVRALKAVLAEGTADRVLRAVCVRRAPASAPDAPALWSRDALYQTLYHSAYLLGAATGRTDATVGRVEGRGAHRPESVRAELTFPGGITGEIVLDFAASAAGAELSVGGERGRRTGWRREADGLESLVRDTPSGDRTTSVERGSDAVGMLTAFRDAVLAGAPSPVPVREGLDAMVTAHAIVEGLSTHLVRPGAPRHVASPALRMR